MNIMRDKQLNEAIMKAVESSAKRVTTFDEIGDTLAFHWVCCCLRSRGVECTIPLVEELLLEVKRRLRDCIEKIELSE